MIIKRILLKLIGVMWCICKRSHKITPTQVILSCIVVPYCYLLYYNYFGEVSLHNEELNGLIENHLKLNLISEKGSGCVMPNLDIFSQEAVDTLNLDYRPKIYCPGTDWVECVKSECYIMLKEVSDDVVCTYTDIIYVNDDEYYLGTPVEVHGNDKYILNRSDHVKVSCVAPDMPFFGLPLWSSWKGVKAGLRPVPITPTQYTVGPTHEYNIMILIVDSTSHNDFIRFMPRFYRYLTDVMEAVILQSHSSLGCNTVTNLFPILTGQAATEQPETRKSMVRDQYVNYKDFIFYQAKQVGYRTAYFEEYDGTFSTYNNGFRQQPTDHYLRSFWQEIALRKKRGIKDLGLSMCVGDSLYYHLMLNLTRHFQDLDGKKISLTHLNQITNNIINYLTSAQDDMVNLLSTLRQRQQQEDTLVIVMSDHGQRHSKFRNTHQGQIEEQLPLMAIALPERLKRNRPEALHALKQNSNVLTTHFDVHATLMDVLGLPYANKYKVPGSKLPRSISLLREIPEYRTCADAGILPQLCICTKWHYVSNSDPKFGQVVSLVSDFIKNMTIDMGNKCATRALKSVSWVRRQGYNEGPQIEDELLKYLENPILLKPNIVFYQAKMVMSPANAKYEAMILYDMRNNYFKISEDDITRTNTYGDESACIEKTYPHLKPYCYCTNESFSSNYGAIAQFEQYTLKYPKVT